VPSYLVELGRSTQGVSMRHVYTRAEFILLKMKSEKNFKNQFQLNKELLRIHDNYIYVFPCEVIGYIEGSFLLCI